MEKVSNKLLRISLAASCTLSLVMPTMVQAQAVEVNEETASVEVYPKPQTINYLSDEGMKLEGTVNLVVHGDQNPATIQKIKALLEEENIQYVESDVVKDDQANILISTDKDHCEDCTNDIASGVASVLDETQGYILNATNDDNAKGDISIVGTDEDGAYYGVMTLTQMMEQKTSDGRMAEAVVSDFPDVKLRGFVEGFYGYTWSYEDRLSLMKESSEFKMNTYIYAPKDDPYHKDQWRTLYPDDKAEELRKLAEEGKKDNMSFCWSVHPGYGFNYNTEDDYNKLIAKFEQLYNLGVRQFGISYDDLSGTANGTQHATLINKVNQNFVKAKGDVKPLIVVATRYCNGWGPSMTSYFKPFISTLNEDVVVMWTGANTMSAITKAAYDWPKAQTGVDRDLAAWWNYPVNDYCDGNLMMSPLENLDNDVDNLTGFFLNPMSQAEASKVAIFSGADYSWNVGDFEKTSSWKRAIDELVPEASESFQRFADNISYIKDGFEFDESRYLVNDLNALSTAMQNNASIKAAASTLKADFEQMIDDVAILKDINNKNLYDEIKVHLDAYEVLAEAGVAAMDAFMAAEDGDISACMDLISTLKSKLAQTETFKIESLESNGTKSNVVKVGEKRIKTMLKDADSQIQTLLMATIMPEEKGSVTSSIEDLNTKTLELSKGNYAITDLAGTLHSDGYITMKLPKAMRLSSITLETANSAELAIQYSINGVEWKTVDTTAATTENGVLTVAVDASAAYIRVINATEHDLDVAIANFEVAPVYNIGNVVATTDLGTYQNNKISNIIDGNAKTKFYSSAGATVGSYVRVDLGKAIPLFDVEAYFATNPKGPAEGIDGFAATKLEISTDGVTWTQIGDIIEDANYVDKTVDGQKICSAAYNADGQMGRYIRFTATEASDNWVQVFEVPYNKTVSNIGDDSVNLIESTFDSGDVTKLYDRDLTSSFKPNSVKDEDSLTYAMTTITNVGSLTIIQDANAISNAEVSVKDLDGNWSNIGTLDKETNIFTVNKEILDVKLTFNAANPTPNIYEVITKEKFDENTEFTKGILKSVIDKADTYIAAGSLDNLAPNVASMIRVRLAEAKAVYDNSYATNAECMDAWLNLANALQYMDFVANKENLKTLIDECENINLDVYVSGVEEFKLALEEANAVYNNEDVLQDTINTAYQNLSKAKDGLVKGVVDKSTLQDIVTAITTKVGDGTKYKHDAAWDAFQTALENANAVLANADATQIDINNALTGLTSAYSDIRLIPNEALLAELQDFVNKVNAADLTLYSEANVSKIMSVRSMVTSLMADPENITEEAYTALQPQILEVLDILENGKLETPATPGEPTDPSEPVDPSNPSDDVNTPADTETPSDSVENPASSTQGTVKPGTTKTGDSTNLFGMAMALIASTGAIIGLKKRKK